MFISGNSRSGFKLIFALCWHYHIAFAAVSQSHLNPTLQRKLNQASDFTASSIHEIRPTEAFAYEWFGSSVFISDHVAIVGAPGDSDYNKYGHAYIYKKHDGKWQQQKKIAPDAAYSDDGFGSAVSIYGGYAFVGAYKDDTNGQDSGAVYYFTESSGWKMQQKLTPDDGAALDYYGSSIAQYRREELVVGAWGADYNGYTSCGAAYFYRYGDGQWNLEVKIVPVDTHSYQWFGISVSIYQSKAVVGAWGDGQGGSVAGAVYAYTHAMGEWEQIQKFNPGLSSVHMGYSVSMYEDVLVVGLPNSYRTPLADTNNPNAYRTGMARVFRLMDYNHWEFEQNLICNDCDNLAAFGQIVSASKSNIVVGLHGAAVVWTIDRYESIGSRWSQEVYLYAENDKIDDSYFLGSAVSVYDNHVMIGVKDVEMRITSSSDENSRTQQAGVAVLFESPRNKSSTNYIVQENLGLYVALYVMIVLGIAVILVAPVAVFGYKMYQQEKDASKMLEMRPFIRKTERAPVPLKKNSIAKPVTM